MGGFGVGGFGGLEVWGGARLKEAALRVEFCWTRTAAFAEAAVSLPSDTFQTHTSLTGPQRGGCILHAERGGVGVRGGLRAKFLSGAVIP